MRVSVNSVGSLPALLAGLPPAMGMLGPLSAEAVGQNAASAHMGYLGKTNGFGQYGYFGQPQGVTNMGYPMGYDPMNQQIAQALANLIYQQQGGMMPALQNPGVQMPVMYNPQGNSQQATLQNLLAAAQNKNGDGSNATGRKTERSGLDIARGPLRAIDFSEPENLAVAPCVKPAIQTASTYIRYLVEDVSNFSADCIPKAVCAEWRQCYAKHLTESAAEPINAMAKFVSNGLNKVKEASANCKKSFEAFKRNGGEVLKGRDIQDYKDMTPEEGLDRVQPFVQAVEETKEGAAFMEGIDNMQPLAEAVTSYLQSEGIAEPTNDQVANAMANLSKKTKHNISAELTALNSLMQESNTLLQKMAVLSSVVEGVNRALDNACAEFERKGGDHKNVATMIGYGIAQRLCDAPDVTATLEALAPPTRITQWIKK